MGLRHRARRITARTAGVAMAGLLVAGLAVVAGPSLASATTGAGMSMADMPGMHQTTDKVGNTKGWFDGKTVTFHYTKNFFCKEPPSSAAVSHCEVGDGYDAIPAGEFDPLYVVVPIGFTPKNPASVQCPVAGKCVDHPRFVDLSRVFGSGTEDALLPPHSHLVTTLAAGQSEWWDVDVIGVKTQAAWHRIVKTKDYRCVVNMRRKGDPDVTENIPTNLFLYFSAR